MHVLQPHDIYRWGKDKSKLLQDILRRLLGGQQTPLRTLEVLYWQ